MNCSKIPLVALFSFFTTLVLAQAPEKSIENLSNNPLYFLDSVNVEKIDLTNINIKQITTMQILSRVEAMASIGVDGKNGVIYMETIPFATKRYQRFFKSKSPDYAALLKNAEQDSTIQYILNGDPMIGECSGKLAAVNDFKFKELKVIDKQTLKNEYGIEGKSAGVVIRSSVPEERLDGKIKF